MCDTLTRLARLSSAEQFFLTLGVEFDPHVLDVHRLHILKRFNELLAVASPRLDDDMAKAALARAYGEFSSGNGAKTFKVFQQQHTGFVPLGSIIPMP